MVRHKDTAPAAAGRSSAIQRHRKRSRHNNDRDRPFIPAGLEARPAVPKSKHKTILEWTENANKKKKLEIEGTTNKNPNANFSFVPIGNPELTNLCKELSREQGALVYIVSTTKEKGYDLSDHVHRIGYHFRTHIVEQAASMVEGLHPFESGLNNVTRPNSGKPDPIPESQEEINKQADAAIRDLFPRIPNTDREMIVRHAFQKGAVFNGKPVVGLQEDLTLSRRVQLAVIAHIRHTHTRYDLLLRETTWENARRTVESLCLDILVKWRGDEETGRDQLDEVLREIVVIDDSEDDEDDGVEEDTETEEEESSDEVSEVALEMSNATPFPSQKPQIRPGSNQPAAAPNNRNQQTGNSVNPPVQNSGIASRTRSKTNPKLRQRARKARRMRRYQAWQDALNRSGERLPRPKTPLEQTRRTDAHQANGSPRLKANNTPMGPSTSSLYTAPENPEYQAIYAIDDGHGRSRPREHLPSSQRFGGLPELSYREQITTRPEAYNTFEMEHDYAHDSRPAFGRAVPANNSRLHPSYATLLRVPASQDKALPSIEQAVDLTIDSPTRISPRGPIRHSQVMYPRVEAERKLLPIRSDVTYIDDWENNQSKRRRIVLANDPPRLPVLSSTNDSYVRLVPQSRSEQHLKMGPSLRRVADVRDARDRNYIPSAIDDRIDHPGYPQRIVDVREHNDLPSMVDSKGHPGTNRAHRLNSSDESLQLVRVIRRAPGPSQPYLRDQHTSEPQAYKSQRAEDHQYYETRRPTMSMQAIFQNDNRPIDPDQRGRTVPQDRAPMDYQQRVAADSSTSLFHFPSHPHSLEMNSGLASYPILSRPHHDHESRFSSARNEPIMTGRQSSHQYLQDGFAVDGIERSTKHRTEEMRRLPKFGEVSPMEPRYVPIDLQDRIQKIEPRYTPLDSQGRVLQVARRSPTSASRSNRPTFSQNLAQREKVIVLSD